uniref:COMM domain-containing protein 1 n=1 Tax=Arcella intermedia TaxID=1963864 RepID=A0A6B2LKM5_9EUKA|eukprot:TRINITY_DN14854_c0_g1_i1.p1 TRINITY_DN14854_c0_g1~~TRINITY_DN14854_c0_g1_i1.p1  ORF type:complete len:191 (+),score=50.85 TRINITY_DN14854_c0_g1_i1:43-615(+)
MDNPKIFRALLNGYMKATFEQDPSITTAFIAQELSLELSEVESVYKSVGEVIQQAAQNHWDLKELENYMKTKTNWSENQMGTTIQFWRANRQKIHDIVVSKSNWNNHLAKLAWRIDMKSRLRNYPQELNEQIAIMEWTIENPNANTQKEQDTSKNNASKVIRFEMDKEQIQATLFQINEIQKVISQASQK